MPTAYFGLRMMGKEPAASTMRLFAVYILSSRSKVLYTGVTGDLVRRLYQHRTKAIQGFTSRYNVKQLVYVEFTENSIAAIEREKEIKSWTRTKRVKLITSVNPTWKDLTGEYIDLDGRQYRDPSLRSG